MQFSIPILIVHERGHAGGLYRARPLFFPAPNLSDANLNRLMNHLARQLTERLHDLGRLARHDALAEYGFSPTLSQHRFELTFFLRRRTFKGRFLIVAFKRHGQRIAFAPSIPDVWFDLNRNESLKERAEEVLTAYFREQEKEEENGSGIRPEAAALDGTAYVTPLELDIYPPSVVPEEKPSPFVMIGGSAEMNGASELRRVGHCIDWLYPDELERSWLRETDLRELTDLLRSEDSRPILLLGPRMVGKTALIHEAVYHRVAARRTAYRDQRNVWHIAPQRLISGMSYVGQWENRLLAILKEVRKRQHILYFDDLLGLFRAGLSASASLSVAAVLKPYIERREIRILGETTPEAFRALQEQDRSFADLFHLIPVRPPTDRDTLRILIGVQRQLESRHRCRFDLDALPTVIDLQRRYGRDAAFPGKAARFLRQIAVKHTRSMTAENDESPLLARSHVLEEFQAQTGLSPLFLDPRGKLERDEIIEALTQKVVGQPRAIGAVADVVAIARARLNDPDRPLGSFLLVGPTGVGKTECAKTLAEYLFGDVQRLIRFDMNEFVDPGSAARLVGTFHQPEGLLTAAVRRQPFAVILLDEIEKADGEVFDLLLQVLGEGRLTDALGRTADFTNTIILLTSNLGVRESEKSLGFAGSSEGGARNHFEESARQFFRPEFFNRIDRIVPFDRLKREDVRRIADRLVEDMLGREGFRQRRCMLQVDPAAIEQIVEAGYDPVLGARALKRAIEKHLTRPIATRLAALPIDRFTIIAIYPGVGIASSEGGTEAALQVRVQALEQVEPLFGLEDQRDESERLEAIGRELTAVEAGFAHLRPTGPIVGKGLTPEQVRYFTLGEQTGQIRERLRELTVRADEREAMGRLRGDFRGISPSRALKKVVAHSHGHYAHEARLLRSAALAMNLQEFVRELAESAECAGDEITELEQQIALLRVMAEGDPAVGAVLWVRCGVPNNPFWKSLELVESYQKAFSEMLALDVVDLTPRRGGTPGEHAIALRGSHAWAIAALESGTQLICPAHAAILPLQMIALPVNAGDDPAVVWRSAQQDQKKWRNQVGDGRAPVADAPYPYGLVTRILTENGNTIDVRTGLVGPMSPNAETLTGFLLAALVMRKEIADAGETSAES